MGTDNLAKMAEKRITWVPTVFAMESYARILSPGSSEREIARRNRDHQLRQIQTAIEYGVKIALGTDAGSPGVRHGPSLWEEIGLLVRSGLALEKVVQCATARGASLLGLEHALGTLLPGLPATFLIFEGRPEGILDPAVAPERVYIAGKTVAGYH
jgi:imidazolonepropionase-like amidohydrolase